MRLRNRIGFVVAAAALVPAGWVTIADRHGAAADPPVTPKATDIVSIGNESVSGLLEEVADDYNTQSPAPARKVRVFDPTGPSSVKLKTGCTATGRTDQGVNQLASNQRPTGDTANYCADLAGTGYSYYPTAQGVRYVQFAQDAVTWSKTSRASAPSNAPDSLSAVELKAIYSCDASVLGTGLTGQVRWNEVGGTGTDLVKAVLPDSSSPLRSFFLSTIGVTTVGACINYSTGPEADQGLAPASLFSGTDSKNVIVPYSVADFLAQSQNGHDPGRQGNQVLGSIEYSSKVYSPTTGSPGNLTINPPFVLTKFTHFVYNAVRDSGDATHVPVYLQPLLGAGNGAGYLCANADAQALILSYGFRLLSSSCGVV